MSNAQAKKIVKSYARVLKKARYPFSAIYLFGSQKKGRVHRWSDIDVAIVSSTLARNRERNRLRLWQLRQGVDWRIEPHGFTPEEFHNDANPMAYEIRKSGSRIE